MKLQIRPSAFSDLARGRWFYDSQELGIGDYFFDSLFSDIDSLKLYAGIHPKVMVITVSSKVLIVSLLTTTMIA